jgi:pimeloyl-ACP methyl ester carboxylesterase
MSRSLKPPGPLLLALESRALLEYLSTLALMPWLRGAPRGDGHPVLVFPGLAASGFSTAPIRKFLNELGYDARCWGLGRNFGPRPGVIEGCLERIEELRRRKGQRVSLVGWSLGGIYAREIAKMIPDSVRSVVTLGAPFTGDPHASNAWRFYEIASGQKIGGPKLTKHLRETPPVPTTSIFSRTDGIVAWQCCVEEEGPTTENIEIQASHFGMGLNPAAMYAVADRLAQAEGQWKPFRRGGLRTLIFRDPTRAGLFGLF